MTRRLISSFSLTGCLLAAPALADEAIYDLAIEPQPILQAFEQLSDVTGLEVLFFSGEAGGKKSSPVVGRYSREQAVQLLLAETGLEAVPLDREGAVGVRSKKPAQKAASQEPSGLVTPLEKPSSARSGTLEEVVVTARKRAETSMSVPVSVTALGAAQIENMALDSFADLAMVVPSLSVAQVSGGIGGSISLRGLGTTAGSNASFEQTVKVNIDGVELSRGSALRLGYVDMGRIEVLRGPQALFFGKNSPAGVISIRTADPSDEFELMARVGYEFNADEHLFDGVVSGPLTERVRARLAVSLSDLDGWMDNQAHDIGPAANAIVPGAVHAPISSGPEGSFQLLRGTVLWDPSDTLSIRTKYNHAELDGPGFQQGPNQRIYCPQGSPQVGGQLNALTADPAARAALAPLIGVDDCKANDTYAHGSINPENLANAPGYADSSKGEGKYTMKLGSIEANWQLNDQFSLTGLTGFANILEERFDTYSYAPSDAVGALAFGGRTEWTQISQELRIASEFSGPFNFMLGGFFDDTELETFTQAFVAPGPRFVQTIEGETVSVFAQGIYELSSSLELSGGARWSKESKDFSVVRNGLDQPVSPSSESFEDVSPEVTLAWRPTEQLTLFASYRKGFKSGGFAAPYINGGPFVAPGPDEVYQPEEVDGFEIGAHAALLDNRLRLNGAVYTYDYQDLQVNSLDNSSGLPVIRVANAAEASIDGVEFDFNWIPAALPGLTLRGSANYSDATFDTFFASCYIGQTQAQGCLEGLNPMTGRYSAQDLAGERLPSAPEWTGTLGLSYETPLGDTGLMMLFSADGSYKSDYNPHPELAPGALQDSAWLLNSSVRLQGPGLGWEVALIGRNLGDEFRVTSASNAPATGSGALTGSTVAGGLADLAGYANRGREVLLQVTVRPSVWLN